MALTETETEQKTIEATGMAEPSLRFVSLVCHAANREPFTSCKNDGEGGCDMSGSVVQKIIAPKDANTLELLHAQGITDYDVFIADAEKSEKGALTIYTNKKSDQFDPTTIELKPILDDAGVSTGISVVTGKMKASGVKSNPKDTEVVTSVSMDYYGDYIVETTTVFHAIDNELYRAVSAIWYINGQEMMDNSARLVAIMAILEGVRKFINQMYELLGESNAQKTEKTIMPLLDAMVGKTKGEDETMPLTDEMRQEIASLTASAFAEAFKAEKAEALRIEAAKADEAKNIKLTDLEASVAALIGERDTLKAEKAELEAKLTAEEAVTTDVVNTQIPKQETVKSDAVSYACILDGLYA